MATYPFSARLSRLAHSGSQTPKRTERMAGADLSPISRTLSHLGAMFLGCLAVSLLIWSATDLVLGGAAARSNLASAGRGHLSFNLPLIHEGQTVARNATIVVLFQMLALLASRAPRPVLPLLSLVVAFGLCVWFSWIHGPLDSVLPQHQARAADSAAIALVVASFVCMSDVLRDALLVRSLRSSESSDSVI